MPQLVPIKKSEFPTWKRMRQALYHALDDEFHDAEMENVHQSKEWFCFFVCTEPDQFIGMVEISARNIVDGCLTSPVAYLEGLYLAEDFRGEGIGSQIIQDIVQWARQKGFQELATDAELSNTRAHHFYTALGFEEVDRVVEFRLPLSDHIPGNS